MPRSSALLFVLLLLLPLSAPAQTAAADSPADPIEGPRVLLRTSMGDVTVQLDPQRAPLTVENFLRHAREGFYNGTVFHRVIENMLIQGGAFTVDLQARPNREPVPNEAAGTLSNLRGTLAAARAPATPTRTPPSSSSMSSTTRASTTAAATTPTRPATRCSAGWSRAWTWSTASARWKPAPARRCRATSR